MRRQEPACLCTILLRSNHERSSIVRSPHPLLTGDQVLDCWDVIAIHSDHQGCASIVCTPADAILVLHQWLCRAHCYGYHQLRKTIFPQQALFMCDKQLQARNSTHLYGVA
eukprot:XP_001704284.1 Hypothetical protein GL50803_118642 [Giardia lamblia ATCC 50803]